MKFVCYRQTHFIVLIPVFCIHKQKKANLAKNASEVFRVDTVSECCMIELYRAKKILFCLWISAFEMNP